MKTFSKSILAILFFITENSHALQLSSAAFDNNGSIPSTYACDGANISPPLSWIDVPKETKSLALIAYDPEAVIGVWTHWVVYNIPPTTNGFQKGIISFPVGTELGITNKNKYEYGGPCPPNGEHHYHFELYALDAKLKLKQPVTRQILYSAMQKHILSKTTLLGRYHLPGKQPGAVSFK